MVSALSKISKHKYAKLFCILLLVVVIGVICIILLIQSQKGKNIMVTNFEECVAISSQILESYPEQCIYEGQTFARQLSAEEKKLLQPPINQ